MSALDERDTDDRRWAEAESVLDKMPTEDTRRRQRRKRTFTWAWIVSLLILCSASGLLLGFLIDGSGGSSGAPTSAWREGVSLTVVATGLVVEVVGIVLLVRAGLWGSRWKAPTAVLTRRQRKSLSRQVLGKAPVDAHHLRLARDLAQRTVKSRVLMLAYTGLIISQVGQALGDTSTWRVWFAGGLVVLFAVTFMVFEVYARRAQRFLRRHPLQTAAR